jgi:outer membrane protein assembly factor BamB
VKGRRSLRWPSFLGAIVFVSLTAFPAGAGVRARSDWPRFQYDAGNSGFNRHERILNAGNVGGLTQAWAVPVYYTSNASVVGGVVYAGGTAIDAATGDVLWDDQLDSFAGVDAFADGVVYVTQMDLGLIALDARTGDVQWEANGHGTLRASPLVVGSLVYTAYGTGAVSAYPTACATPCPPTWSVDLGKDEEPPAYANGVLYAVADGATHNVDTLYALDPMTGAIQWTSAPKVGTASSAPVVVRGVVYTATTDEIVEYPAVCSSPCSPILEIPVPVHDSVGGLAVARGRIYASVAGVGLGAFDAATGAILWSADTGACGTICGYPTIAGGVVYKLGADRLFAFDAVTGTSLLTNDLASGTGASTVAVADGSVYARGSPGVLYALRLPGSG